MKENTQFKVIRLGKGDTEIFRKAVHVFHLVFGEQSKHIVSENSLEKLLRRADFITLVILHGDNVIAALTAHELPMYYSEKSEIFIYDIAVLPEYQRQGLGHLLMDYIKEYGYENGASDVFVAAHKEDQAAVAFYQRTGGKAEDVLHFNYFLDN